MTGSEHAAQAPLATEERSDRLTEVETILARLTTNAVTIDGERYVTHSETVRLLSMLHGITDSGGNYHVKRARDAGRLRTIAPHSRARFYASTDVLALLRTA